MFGRHFSVILLPTNKCNVACDYCFEDKTDDFMSIEMLDEIIEKLLDHMDRKDVTALTIYWQGGEVMMLPPAWFERANDLIAEKAASRGRFVEHSLQSNMIGYSGKWNRIIRDMFGNSVGTSMDFPNLFRRARNRSTEEYTNIWNRNVREARDAGIQIGVIAIPNNETVRLGARRFYSYFVDELHITDFQVNTSFSGGEPCDAKLQSILDMNGLSKFVVDLAHIWAERGFRGGVKLGPFDQLLNYFIGDVASLPCIWQQNCADEFVSIDARGYVAQCDCWVTSYPDYWFGNIFAESSFTDLLKKSPARRKFQMRPEKLMTEESCADCHYLSVCHGGCPVRTYSITGDFFRKDPYCEVYKALFSTMEQIAAGAAWERASRTLPVMRVAYA